MTMPVSFERIPANIRVPLFYAEISNREAAYFQTLQPTLLIGPMLESGAATPLEPVLVIDAAQAYGLFGAGSVLGDMMQIYRRNDSFGTVWAIGVPEGTGAQAATLTDNFTGTAEAAGVMALYIGGDRYAVPVAMGHDAEAIAQAVADTVNADPFALVTATATQAGSVRLEARTAGPVGNELTRQWNWRGISAGEMLPPGLSVAQVGGIAGRFSGGTGVVDMAPVIAAMGDDEYDFICIPWTDTTTLNAMTEAMNDVTGRWAWDRQIYGHVFASRTGTAQDLVTFGRTRNDPHTSVLGFAESPTVSWRRAAAFCGQGAVGLRNDPARPLQTLQLIGVLPPKRGARFNIGTSNTLLYNGIATEMEAGGGVAIQRAATTYRVNLWNQPDPSWLDIQTPFTLAYIIRFLRMRILQKFPRHKLADDGTPLGFGQAVVTPRIIKAELIAAYSEMMSMGVVENMEAFKAFLIVERDPNDPNRVNVLLPPDLVNQLRIFAMLVEFRLQYSAAAMGAAGLAATAAGAIGTAAAPAIAAPPPPRPGYVPMVPPIAPFTG
jgi:phage tail sheath gpL-like